MKGAKIGRPPVPKKLAKVSLLSVRLTVSERKSLERAAQKQGTTVSKWARAVLLEAARDTA